MEKEFQIRRIVILNSVYTENIHRFALYIKIIAIVKLASPAIKLPNKL